MAADLLIIRGRGNQVVLPRSAWYLGVTGTLYPLSKGFCSKQVHAGSLVVGATHLRVRARNNLFDGIAAYRIAAARAALGYLYDLVTGNLIVGGL